MLPLIYRVYNDQLKLDLLRLDDQLKLLRLPLIYCVYHRVSTVRRHKFRCGNKPRHQCEEKKRAIQMLSRETGSRNKWSNTVAGRKLTRVLLPLQKGLLPHLIFLWVVTRLIMVSAMNQWKHT